MTQIAQRLNKPNVLIKKKKKSQQAVKWRELGKKYGKPQRKQAQLLHTWRSWRRPVAESSPPPGGGDLFSHWRGTPSWGGPGGFRFHTGAPVYFLFFGKDRQTQTGISATCPQGKPSMRPHGPPNRPTGSPSLTSPNWPSPSFSLKMRYWRGSSGSGEASAPGLEEASAGTA